MRSVNGRIYVQTDKGNFGLCHRVLGARFATKLDAWSYPASPSTAQALLNAFRGTPVTADTAFRDLVKRAKAMREAQGIKSADDLPAIPCTKTEPWLHQLRSFHFAMPMSACMLALDMGCGKTKVAIDLIVHDRGRYPGTRQAVAKPIDRELTPLDLLGPLPGGAGDACLQ